MHLKENKNGSEQRGEGKKGKGHEYLREERSE